MVKCWFDYKTVVVTGASSGIGKGLVKRLIKKGLYLRKNEIQPLFFRYKACPFSKTSHISLNDCVFVIVDNKTIAIIFIIF